MWMDGRETGWPPKERPDVNPQGKAWPEAVVGGMEKTGKAQRLLRRCRQPVPGAGGLGG